MYSFSKKIFFLLAAVIILSSCRNQSISPAGQSYGLFTVQDDSTAILNGVIKGNTLKKFEKLMKKHPNIQTLVMQDMPGSANDEVNVQLGRAVHARGLNTHIDDNGEIASGAVDLYLAGSKRTAGANVKIGVHSWSNGDQEATDFAEDDSEHDLFIQYYQDIGIRDSMASAFYFYTIHAAPAAEIHWMTEAEIEAYEMYTN